MELHANSVNVTALSFIDDQLTNNDSSVFCSALKRELQSLADQEKIPPAAIKKTTQDKVLQQPSMTAEAVGVRSRGISMFNSIGPATKKKWSSSANP